MKEAAVGVDVATSFPALSVDSSAFAMFGSQRVPIVASDDEELRAVRRPTTVEEACERKPFANVPREVSESEPAVIEPTFAVFALSVVVVAVSKKAVPETVSAVDEAFRKYDVEDAMRPALAQMGVEVDCTATP